MQTKEIQCLLLRNRIFSCRHVIKYLNLDPSKNHLSNLAELRIEIISGMVDTLHINTIRCKKLDAVFSSRKNLTQPSVNKNR